jgi:rod shape-determining protein MreC
MRFLQFDTDGISHYIHTFLVLFLALILGFTRNQESIQQLRLYSVTIASILEEPISNFRLYRNALQTNSYLQEQNILLQDELSRLRSISKENMELRSLLELKDKTSLKLEVTQIVAKQLNTINNSFTIDKGKNEEIRVGMPLINSDGLIGKILLVAPEYSQIMPYSHPLFRVSAQIQSNRANGIITWDASDPSYLQMDFIPKTVKIDTGMVIQTSGFGNEFPRGIPIGKVVDYHSQEGSNTQQLRIQPFSNLFDVTEAYVILFTPDSTIQAINTEFNALFE